VTAAAAGSESAAASSARAQHGHGHRPRSPDTVSATDDAVSEKHDAVPVSRRSRNERRRGDALSAVTGSATRVAENQRRRPRQVQRQRAARIPGRPRLRWVLGGVGFQPAHGPPAFGETAARRAGCPPHHGKHRQGRSVESSGSGSVSVSVSVRDSVKGSEQRAARGPVRSRSSAPVTVSVTGQGSACRACGSRAPLKENQPAFARRAAGGCPAPVPCAPSVRRRRHARRCATSRAQRGTRSSCPRSTVRDAVAGGASRGPRERSQSSRR
jgi:hypothetical protein